jgi:hypothetical protein
MPFDIATNVAPNMDTGTFLQFQTPAGAPLVDDDKNPVGVILRARNSQAGLAQLRANGNRRIADAQSGVTKASVERGEAEMAELLVACTVEFRGIDTLDGVTIDPKSTDFARKFWGDDRFKRERSRAEDWISDEANFTKR